MGCEVIQYFHSRCYVQLNAHLCICFRSLTLPLVAVGNAHIFCSAGLVDGIQRLACLALFSFRIPLTTLRCEEVSRIRELCLLQSPMARSVCSHAGTCASQEKK